MNTNGQLHVTTEFRIFLLSLFLSLLTKKYFLLIKKKKRIKKKIFNFRIHYALPRRAEENSTLQSHKNKNTREITTV